MRVELLQDVLENGVIKTTIRPRKKMVIGWFQGTQMEVSDTTGNKLIEQSVAKKVEEESAE